MTIVNKLRKLITLRGGDPTGVMTIAQGVNALCNLEDAANEPENEPGNEPENEPGNEPSGAE